MYLRRYFDSPKCSSEGLLVNVSISNLVTFGGVSVRSSSFDFQTFEVHTSHWAAPPPVSLGYFGSLHDLIPEV